MACNPFGFSEWLSRWAALLSETSGLVSISSGFPVLVPADVDSFSNCSSCGGPLERKAASICEFDPPEVEVFSVSVL